MSSSGNATGKRAGRTQRALSRRALLKGAGGALVGLPLLHSLGASAGPSSPIKRLVLMYNPNGTVWDAFWPTGGETDFVFGEMLTPLQPFRDRVSVLKGIDLAVTAVGPGGPHQRGCGGLFTGRELQEGTFTDGCGSLAGWANGPSIDQVYAEHLGISTALPSLELGIRATAAEVRGRMFYKSAGNPVPPVNDPQQVWSRMFWGSDGDPDARLVQMDKRRSVLDSVQAQFASLNPQLSPADRQRLDAHQVMVREMELRLELAAAASGGSEPELACPKPPNPGSIAFDDAGSMPLVAQLQMQLLALAFSCDLTRVGSVTFSSAINDIGYPWLGSTDSGHTLSHAGPSDEAAQRELINRGKWQAEQLAYLMALLDNIPEEDGSVLDNTIILWGSEVSLGNVHSHTDMPWVLAGGAAGALKMGRFLEFDGVPHNRLLVSVLNALGVGVDRFGHPDFAVGSLSGLEA